MKKSKFHTIKIAKGLHLLKKRDLVSLARTTFFALATKEILENMKK